MAEAQLREAEARLAADRLALQLEQQRVAVAEDKATAALQAAKEQAARADEERAWLRQQQQDLTPRLENTSVLQAEAKQRARELAQEAAELHRERQSLDAERTTLERLRQQLEASQAQADKALAQAADVAAKEAALAAKERGVVELEAALKLREAAVAQASAAAERGRCWGESHRPLCKGSNYPLLKFPPLPCLPSAQAEAATSSEQRLTGLSKELESRAAADSGALRRLQESLAAQQEELQRCVE